MVNNTYKQKNRHHIIEFDFKENYLLYRFRNRWQINSYKTRMSYDDINIAQEEAFEASKFGIIDGVIGFLAYSVLLIFFCEFVHGLGYPDAVPNIPFIITTLVMLPIFSFVFLRTNSRYLTFSIGNGGLSVWSGVFGEQIIEEIKKRVRAETREMYMFIDPSMTLTSQRDRFEWLYSAEAISEEEYQSFIEEINKRAEMRSSQ